MLLIRVSSSAKQTHKVDKAHVQDKERRGRGRPKKADKSGKQKLTVKMKFPSSSPERLSEKDRVNRTAKLKPEFSDLDDSLLIETLKPGSSKVNAEQSTVKEEISGSSETTRNSESPMSEKLDFIKISSPIHSSTLRTLNASPILPSAKLNCTLEQKETITNANDHVFLDCHGDTFVSLNGDKSDHSNGLKRVFTSSSDRIPDPNKNTALHPDNDASSSRDDVTGSSDLNCAENLSRSRSSPRNTAESLGYSFCQICQKNISGYSADQRRSHVNKCCDALETANNFGSRNSLNSQGKRQVPARINCPLCPKNYCDKSAVKKHLKTCCEERSKCYETVCEMLFASSSKISVDIDGSKPKKETTKKTKSKEKQSTPLLMENNGAINDAQNRILDIVADQDSKDEVPATPALKVSKLTTYRSKRNSIWNVAGSATTTVPNVLKHENSLINTQKSEDIVQPLPASVPDDPICMEKSSLPSQADITQLTQFLTDLGKNDSMKETLSNIMLSPTKLRTDSASLSQGSDVNSLVTESFTKMAEYVCPEVRTIQIKNSFKKRSNSSLSCPEKSRTDSDETEESEEENEEIENKNGQSCGSKTESSPAPINRSKSDPGPKSEEEIIHRCETVPNILTDRSPNPSDISAVGESLHIRTPARDTSEIVSLRDAESILPDHCSVQEDSNLDLFGEGNGMERREFDRSPDRSLLNVSPITDSGLNEVDVVKEERKVKKSVSVQIPEENRISPIYRPKHCSSTTRDCNVLTVPAPQSHKNIQVDKETRNIAAGTDVTTRAKGTNTDIVRTRNVACDISHIDTRSVPTQADGEHGLAAMMRRLLADTPSSDVTLLCTDWTEKRAHRVILNASCPALLACSGPQIPDDSSLVKLEIGPEAADKFMEYVYTREIEDEDIRPTILSELFDIAERLDMAELTNHLHTKRTETIEIEFKQESGTKIQLNLSAQDMLNLSQQIQTISSQNRSSVSLDNTFQQDIPSFQEHGIFPAPSPELCDRSQGHILDGDLFEEVEVSNQTAPNEGSGEDEGDRGDREVEGGVMEGNISDLEDLPSTGLILEEYTAQTPPPQTPPPQTPPPQTPPPQTSPPQTTTPQTPQAVTTEEDRRVSQLIQDVEFIDLVKKLDDPIVNSPLSFIDNLSPIRLDTVPTKLPADKNQDISVIDLDDSATEAPISRNKLLDSTPKPSSKNKGVMRRPNLELELSVYDKTPNFKGMNTPKLKAEVGKYGLKPLSKKRAVAKLEEIHRFTNKKFLKRPSELEDEMGGSEKSKTKFTPTKSQPSRAVSSSTTSNKKQQSRSRKRRNSSSSSSSEKECPVGDITVSEKLPKSAAGEVSDQIRSAIRSKETLHTQVLLYQAVDILEIKGLLKRRTGVGLIAQVLDDLGITYFNSETKGRKGGAGKRAKK
ncbi:uncharacterized protein LOC134815337 isoform X2 [Bolinopsis microptera]|uniref:uncharacterized protein LOC134815337 isoform X2 n=1 Tax=Bolinopsis microptera TaxID=2820187 RepID=UPI0030798982